MCDSVAMSFALLASFSIMPPKDHAVDWVKRIPVNESEQSLGCEGFWCKLEKLAS